MRKPIGCDEVIEKLFAFLDGELDEAAHQEIERHLETCRGCFSRAEFERRLKSKIAEAGEAKAPASLRRRIRRMIARY